MSEPAAAQPEPADLEFASAYADLRRLAGYLLKSAPPAGSPQATSLVNEAYLKYQGATVDGITDRRHLINTVALMMRQVLIDRVRQSKSLKRGGNLRQTQSTLSGRELPQPEDLPIESVESIHEAMQELEAFNDRWGEVTRLRYFAGLTIEQTAHVMGVSVALVKKDWSFARTWLLRTLHGDSTTDASVSSDG